MSGLELRDELAEVPNTAKLVYVILLVNGGLTQGEIADASRVPPRTVRHALEQLNDAGLVESEPYMGDARKSLYYVSDGGGG